MTSAKLTMAAICFTGTAGLLLAGSIAWNAASGNPVDVSAGQLASTIFGGFLGYLTRAATETNPNEESITVTKSFPETKPTEPVKPDENKAS